jgi:anti-sigma factor RsiW
MPQNQLNVNRNVVRDLLPVYLAGEASRDTRALVEAFLEQDPVLRAEAEAARSMGGGLPPVVPPDAVEARALAQTQSFVRQRSAWMGAAIAFTILPHSKGTA